MVCWKSHLLNPDRRGRRRGRGEGGGGGEGRRRRGRGEGRRRGRGEKEGERGRGGGDVNTIMEASYNMTLDLNYVASVASKTARF